MKGFSPIAYGSQHGFTIVSAIFILVVLAALGAFVVTISTTQQIGSALDIQGTRALMAARSGLEWGVYQVQASASYQFGFGVSPGANPNTTANPSTTRVCPAGSSSFTFPNTAPTLSGFSVTVKCDSFPDTVSGPTVFRIISTACSQPNASVPYCPNLAPGANYIERRVEVTF